MIIRIIIKQLLYGLAGGSLALVMIIMFWDLTGYDGLYAFFDKFTVLTLRALAIAIGFSISGIVYYFERPALWLKVSFNLFVGLGVMYFVGFIPLESPINIIINVTIAVVLLVISFLVDYLLSGREAKKINAKLREHEENEDIDG